MARKKKKKKKQRGSTRGEIDPKLGCTVGHLKAQIRSALRKTWRNSSRRVYIQTVRIPYTGIARFKYGVICEECNTMLGQSQKEYLIKKDGSRSKNKRLVYECDHYDANHPLIDIEKDLGKYAMTLLFGSLRILCRKCHTKHTDEQRNVRTALNKTKIS